MSSAEFSNDSPLNDVRRAKAAGRQLIRGIFRAGAASNQKLDSKKTTVGADKLPSYQIERSQGDSMQELSPLTTSAYDIVPGPTSTERDDSARLARAFTLVLYVFRTIGARVIKAGLVDMNALAIALTTETTNPDTTFPFGDTFIFFNALGTKSDDEILTCFVALYLIAFFTKELLDSLLGFKREYTSLGQLMIQQIVDVAVGNDVFRENQTANSRACFSTAHIAKMILGTDVGYSIFPGFPTFSPSRYSSMSVMEEFSQRRILDRLITRFELHGFPNPLRPSDGNIRAWRFLASETNHRTDGIARADQYIGTNFGRVLYWLICSAQRMTPGKAVVAYFEQHIALIKFLGENFGYKVRGMNDFALSGSHQGLKNNQSKPILDSWVIILPSRATIASSRVPAEESLLLSSLKPNFPHGQPTPPQDYKPVDEDAFAGTEPMFSSVPEHSQGGIDLGQLADKTRESQLLASNHGPSSRPWSVYSRSTASTALTPASLLSLPPGSRLTEPAYLKTPPPPHRLQIAQALFDFVPEAYDELPFSAGDILEIVEESEALKADGWCRARRREDKMKIGLVPRSYLMVKPIQQPTQSATDFVASFVDHKTSIQHLGDTATREKPGHVKGIGTTSDFQLNISRIIDDIIFRIGHFPKPLYAPQRLIEEIARLLEVVSHRFENERRCAGESVSMHSLRHNIDSMASELTGRIKKVLQNSAKQARHANEWQEGRPETLASGDIERWNDITTLSEGNSTGEDLIPESGGLELDDPGFYPDDKSTTMFLTSSTYPWMVSKIHSKLSMYLPPLAPPDLTEDCITFEFPASRLSSQVPEGFFPLYLEVDWNLRNFLDDQAAQLHKRNWLKEDLVSLDSFEYAITITGSSCDAQSLPCIEYVDLVWPDVGLEVINIIKSLNKSPFVTQLFVLNSATRIYGIQNSSKLLLDLQGDIYQLAEIFEILGWLSATFRTPPSTGGPWSSVAKLEPFYGNMFFTKNDKVKYSKYEYSKYQMTFTMEQIKVFGPSRCWQKMFHSPVVVLGYPIRQRAEYQTGLEVSLAIIDAMLQKPYVNVFNSKLFIKGISAMLIPTGRKQDLLMWHYLYDEHGRYIDFLEATVPHTEGVTPSNLDSMRHIVGWCDQARSNAGTPWQKGHKVGLYRLPNPTASIALKTFQLSGSYSGFSISFPVLVGIRDPPIWVAPYAQHVETRLELISALSVVLWDVPDKRGWLLDGVSALLHLLRASISNSSKFSTYCLDASKLIEPSLDKYPECAKDFFLANNHQNLGLVIFPGTAKRTIDSVTKWQVGNGVPQPVEEVTEKISRTPCTIDDEFLRLWTILAHIHYQQKQNKFTDGYQFRPSLTNYLLGWDFAAIVEHAMMVEPRQADLPSTTDAWANLTRSIEAVTLFGSGFGEIIRPEPNSCPEWSVLPGGMYYLAISEQTLRKIASDREDLQLKDRIHYRPTKGRCSCKKSHLNTILIGRKLKKKRNEHIGRPAGKSADKSADCPYGAIIFGTKEPESFTAHQTLPLTQMDSVDKLSSNTSVLTDSSQRENSDSVTSVDEAMAPKSIPNNPDR